MSENKQYEIEYKVQAVKLARKIGAVNAANELQIPVNTLYGWIKKAKSGSLDIGCGRTQPGRISEYRRRKPAAEKADKSIRKRKQASKRNE